MSPLPERRKTPEELAALRQSLGIPSTPEESDIDPETPSAPAASLPKPKPEALVEEPETPAAESTEESSDDAEAPSAGEDSGEEEEEVIRVEPKLPTRSLRKSASLPVDLPKKQAARPDSGVIPQKRHSDEELNRIRKAAQLTPAVADLVPKIAHPALLATLYGIGVILIFTAILGAISSRIPVSDLPFDWLMELNLNPQFPMILFGILVGGAATFLLSAAWLAWARPLSRHHAGFMTIMAVLVLVFGTLYFFPELHAA